MAFVGCGGYVGADDARDALRRAEAARDRPRHRRRAEAPVPRRACGRTQSHRDRARSTTSSPSWRVRGITIVLVEHDMKLVMNVSDHILVLDNGRKLAEGTPEEVRRNPEGDRRLSRRRRVRSLTPDASAARGRGPRQPPRPDRGVARGQSRRSAEGELVALVGANGAGKTTLLRCVSGVQSVAAGTIRFAGQDIDPHEPGPAGAAGRSPRRPRDARCSRRCRSRTI